MLEAGSIARWLVIIGLAIAGAGILIGIASHVPGLNRLGNLPGDIRYTSADGSFGCFVPIVSSILLSVILTVVLNLVVRLINR